MRFPKMRPQRSMELKIPDLAGGMNLRDGLSEVLDNQLTDCKNVWWQDGALKTRPGTKTIGIIPMKVYAKKINPKQTDVFVGKYRLFYYNIQGFKPSKENEFINHAFFETGFWLQSNNETLKIASIERQDEKSKVNFVCQSKNFVYAFCENYKIFRFEFPETITKDLLKDRIWEEVDETAFTVPLVYSHCKPIGDYGYEFEGTQVDGFNILSPYYKAVYSTVNIENAEHRMRYKLPVTLPTNENISYQITAEHTFFNEIGLAQTVTHTIEWKGGNTTYFEDADHSGDDGLYMFVNPNYIIFSTVRYKHGESQQDEGYDDPKILSEADFFEDNLVITSVSLSSDGEKSKIFNMTRCEWFGGNASGINGGTRLFLCGNSGQNKALMLWSGLNDPLYFSENSSAYVGNENQAVTCFGKQGETLVIFKENGAGCFYTSYVQNQTISASDLIGQSVLDYSSSSIYFPIIQLHSTIGCDCPDSIQLCRNRLVWACKNGKVYTLAAQNQYSERNIFCLSEMIERKLNKEDLANAFSADYNGHYLLFVKNHVYVMNYESYGYVYISSHTKEDNAQVKIPWWYWELPRGEYNYEAISVISLGTDIQVVFYPKSETISNERGFSIRTLVGDLLTDDNKKIPSMLRSKLFDFGQPSFRKNVDKINLQLGNNGGEPIKVKIITECGEESQEITLTGNETQNYTPGYIESKAIFPCIRQTVKIGLELSSTGVLAIDGISFKYRTTGGAR